MFKYIILPRWLYLLFKDNNQPFRDLLNYEKLVSLLSQLELFFYIDANLKNYDEIFISQNANKLLKILKTMNCENVLYESEFHTKDINNLIVNKKIPVSIERFLRYLIENPLYTLNKEYKLTQINFEAMRIDDNVLAFIPTIKDLNMEKHSIRRDIYKVMNSYMTAYDIVQSPIFGI